MLSLELIDKTGENRQFHLRDNQRELIGRAAPLLTFNDAHLSRRHALLRPHDGRWCIRDLGSTHGTFLNGCRIGRNTPLRAGDRIRVGCTEFHVRAAALDPPSPATATPAPHAGNGWRIDAYLELKVIDDQSTHAAKGRVFRLHNPDRQSLGREGCDLKVRDSRVSRRHAVFYVDEGKWVIEDCSSLHGTKVNGHKISLPQTIVIGDQIEMGRLVIAVRKARVLEVNRPEPDNHQAPTAELAESPCEPPTRDVIEAQPSSTWAQEESVPPITSAPPEEADASDDSLSNVPAAAPPANEEGLDDLTAACQDMATANHEAESVDAVWDLEVKDAQAQDSDQIPEASAEVEESLTDDGGDAVADSAMGFEVEQVESNHKDEPVTNDDVVLHKLSSCGRRQGVQSSAGQGFTANSRETEPLNDWGQPPPGAAEESLAGSLESISPRDSAIDSGLMDDADDVADKNLAQQDASDQSHASAPSAWPEDISAYEPMTEQADSSPDVLMDDENGSRANDADGPTPKAGDTKRFANRRLLISTGKVLRFAAKWWHADKEKMPSLNVVEEQSPSTLVQEPCHIPIDPSPTQDANNNGDPLPNVCDARPETDEKDRDDRGAACDYLTQVNQDTVCVNAISGVKDQEQFTGDSDGLSMYWQLALWGWDEASPADALDSDSLHDGAINPDGPTVADAVVEANLFRPDNSSELPPFMPVTDPQDTEADVRPVLFESIRLDIPKRLPDVVINFRSLSPGSAAMTQPSRCAKQANTNLSKPNRPALRRQTVLAASGFLLH